MKGITFSVLGAFLLVFTSLLVAEETKLFRLGEPEQWTGERINPSGPGFSVEDGEISLKYHFCSDSFTFRSDIRLKGEEQLKISLFDQKQENDPVWIIGLYRSRDVLFPSSLGSDKPYAALDSYKKLGSFDSKRAIRLSKSGEKSLVRNQIKELPKGERLHLSLSNSAGKLRALITGESGEAVSFIQDIDSELPGRKTISVVSKGAPRIIGPELATESSCER